MSTDANKDCVVRHFEELWNKGQLGKVDEFFAKDFTNFGQLQGDGRLAIKGIVGVWREAFPDLHFTVDHIAAEADTVMCEVTFQGTQMRELPLIPPLHGPGLAASGKAFKVKHIHRFRLVDALIVEHFAVRDDLGMFRQLGHLATVASAD
jgi:predicted ester cyclase